MSTLVQCMNQDGEPRAVEIDPASRFYGWVFYKHPDGQWVTLRKANECELELAVHTAQYTQTEAT